MGTVILASASFDEALKSPDLPGLRTPWELDGSQTGESEGTPFCENPANQVFLADGAGWGYAFNGFNGPKVESISEILF